MADAERQDFIRSVLKRLQSLKMNHIAKTKLATENDRVIAQIYNRLMAAVEARYKSGDFADFLTSYSLQMAETEKRNNSNLTEFFSYLGDVVKAAKNDRADVIGIIENYIRAAPVTNPVTAVRFILNNSYSNGNISEKAVGYAREDAAPDVETTVTVEGPLEEAAILPPLELPQMLPPMTEEPVDPVKSTTEDKVDKTSEPVPEKTPVPVMTTPSNDSSVKVEPRAESSLNANLQAEYSASVQKPNLELPLKTK